MSGCGRSLNAPARDPDSLIAASGQATTLAQSVTLTQARFFMDDGT
jgi:hypothetical protein